MHTFFIHFSIEGHLGCFQVLAITNSAAMNIVEQCFCSMIGHLLGIFPTVELLGPEGSGTLVLEIMFSSVICEMFSHLKYMETFFFLLFTVIFLCKNIM